MNIVEEILKNEGEKMNKKGQATMEFLITYGWAILVVLVAIVALVYFGVINPEKFNPNVVLCQYLNEDFPVITQQKQRLLEYYDINTISIDISKAKTNNVFNDSRECVIPATICNDLFCNEVGMFVLVNYTEYREWLK